MVKQSHEERTASEPRGTALHSVKIGFINEINPKIRIIRLELLNEEAPGINFLPGQFLDVFCPGIEKAGGFTITSPPSRSQRQPSSNPRFAGLPYLELAVQKSPENPAAAYLWLGQPSTKAEYSDDDDDDDDHPEHGQFDKHEGEPGIIGTQLQVRIGGSFVYPPQGVDASQLRRVVLVAGGIGVNPLASIAAHVAEKSCDDPDQPEVRFLYSLRSQGGRGRAGEADGMLFLDRIANLFAREQMRGQLQLFLTLAAEDDGDGSGGEQKKYTDMNGNEVPADGVVWCNEVDVPFQRRRITVADLAEAVGPEPNNVVIYVCGASTMTDEFVKLLTDGDAGIGMDEHRVKFEKWW